MDDPRRFEVRDLSQPLPLGSMTYMELQEVLFAVRRLRRLRAEPNPQVTVLVRATTGDPAPWIEFSVGDKQYGIWRASGQVFEADEDGAMGEDPVL